MADTLQTDHRLDRLRDAACLAHLVPGTALRPALANDESILVARGCLGADLHPCQLRSVLIADRHHDLRVLTDLITAASIVSGLVDLGGGLYQRTTSDADVRWFTSSLGADELTETLRQCPRDDAFELTIEPVSELGRSAVCLRALTQSTKQRLDEVALRTVSRCLVGELLSGLDGETI